MKSNELAPRGPDEVFNQPPPFEGRNLYELDLPLREAATREGAPWIHDRARALGEIAGRPEMQKLADLANRYPPVLHTHDRFGHRIDEVEYHPAYHQLMELSVKHDCHALPWSEPRAGAHVARGVLAIVRGQLEEGTGCPITMTFAVVPSLRLQPDVAEQWVPRVLSDTYDPRFIPAEGKHGVLFGMAMTERQGGSDVRANTSRAQPIGAGGPGAEYEIVGHKWFCSAPMCDAFLTLAQTREGLSCFLMPRWRPDGTRNAFHINRLKDKLGNRSNASSEIELRGAWARMVGPEGRGVATIIEMVRHTRLDCVFGSAASMRHALTEALHHASHRSAFGRRLAEQPLMKNVLADLAIECEASTALALRLARAFDETEASPSAARFARIATGIAKYWVTKRNPVLVAEALECLGGNGFIEESPMPRLFRDSPLNSVWEGTGNVQCLDVLRAMGKDPGSVDVLLEELGSAVGADRCYDAFLERLRDELGNSDELEHRARRVVEALALALQASVLIRAGHAAVSDAFCASRLGQGRGLAFGTLEAGCDVDAVLRRAWPG